MEKAVIELGSSDPYLNGVGLQHGDAGYLVGQGGCEDIPLVIVKGDLFLCHNEEFLRVLRGWGRSDPPIPFLVEILKAGDRPSQGSDPLGVLILPA